MTCRLYILIAGLLACLPMAARERASGWCEKGGVAVTIPSYSGLSTTPKTQASYPGCNVTVYVAGTNTLATIYSDNNGTARSNPFQADTLTGAWLFYADNGRYDVQLSGAGMATYTQGDKLLSDLPPRFSVNTFPGYDNTGASDQSPVFAAAISAAVARGGAEIFVPCGTYLLNSTVSILTPNVSLLGESEACVTLSYSGTGTALRIQMIPFVSTPAGHYANFYIKGTNVGLIGLQTGSLVSGKFENIIVDGFNGVNGVGISLQDRLDAFPGSGGSWTERNTFVNVSGGGATTANNTVDWKLETVGSPGNTSFGYNRFINIQANTHSAQTGFWITSGSFFYNSTLTMTCNMDEQTGYTTPSICVRSEGNSDQNAVTITGEYSGTHTGYSIQASRFVATGTVNVTGTTMNFTGTVSQAPALRVTTAWDSQTADAGTYSMTSNSSNIATPSIAFADRQGIGAYGELMGNNIASPFTTMFESANNRFIVASLPFNAAISGMHERFSVDTAGNTWQSGFSSVNLTSPSARNSSFTMDLNGSLLVRGCNYLQAASGTINIGGCTTTGRAGNYSAYLTTTATGISELLGLGDVNWSTGLGAVVNTNVAHPIVWALAGDTLAFEWYNKTFTTALTSANRVAWMTIGGQMVANSYATTSGATGLTIVKNVMGSNSAACTLTFTGGILTASTCP